MTQRVLLWDIDGTIMTAQGAAQRAILRTLRDLHKLEGDLSEMDFRGRTDSSIARDIFVRHELHLDPTVVDAYLNHYGRVLAEELADAPVKVYPGVPEVLELARQRGWPQGLLTGNIAVGAEAKLKRVGLWDYFTFGAYGDDDECRNKLASLAVQRGREFTKRDFAPAESIVLGDTPRDIDCARAAGAKVLAVATGGYSLEELKAHGADAALEDLSKTEDVMALLERL